MPTREETSRELGNTEIDKRERQLGSQTRTQRHSRETQRRAMQGTEKTDEMKELRTKQRERQATEKLRQ